jgi:hypothetical protein
VEDLLVGSAQGFSEKIDEEDADDAEEYES